MEGKKKIQLFLLQQPTVIPTWMPLKPHPKKTSLFCMIHSSSGGAIYKDVIRYHLFRRAAVVLHCGQTSFWHIQVSYTQVIFNLDQFPNSSNHTDICTSNTEGVGRQHAAPSSSDKLEQKSYTLQNKHQEMTDLAGLLLLLVRSCGEIRTGNWYGHTQKQQ